MAYHPTVNIALDESVSESIEGAVSSISGGKGFLLDV
jgi:hypothetical protein